MSSGGLTIGDAAARAGLPVKTVRYYDEAGLVRPGRGANGYRVYGETEVHKLAFLRRARGLGFSIEACRALLSLYEDHGRASADVRRLALDRVAQIDDKLAELQELRQVLVELVDACQGDTRPDCPILDRLSGEEVP
ncbi:MAG: MerR family DNA-binding protein [Rhodospirillaceae bacterium]|nr:MerR family DNA-binding protein [Rhodospirillaceae bacterium]